MTFPFGSSHWSVRLYSRPNKTVRSSMIHWSTNKLVYGTKFFFWIYLYRLKPLSLDLLSAYPKLKTMARAFLVILVSCLMKEITKFAELPRFLPHVKSQGQSFLYKIRIISENFLKSFSFLKMLDGVYNESRYSEYLL